MLQVLASFLFSLATIQQLRALCDFA